MERRGQRRARATLTWLILIALGCGDTGGGLGCDGCGGCAPIPGGFKGQKANNAITAKVSSHTFRYLEQNITPLIQQFLGTGLSFDIPCMQAAEIAGSKAYVCDLRKNQCASDDPAARAAGACRADAEIRSVAINPVTNAQGNAEVKVVLRLYVKTGRIPVRVPAVICDVECNVSFDSARGSVKELPIDVTLKMEISPDWGNILAVDVAGLDLVNAIEDDDIRFQSGSGFCSFVCGIADVGFIKGFLLDFLKGPIDEQVRTMVDSFRCRACGEPGPNQCPTSVRGTKSECRMDGNDPMYCWVKATQQCVPTLFGVEGRVDAGELLADFGGLPGTLLDVYAVAGGRSSDGKPAVREDKGGLVIGVMGGSGAPVPSKCVPTQPWMPRSEPRIVDYDKEAAAANLPAYKVGLTVSDNFIDRTLHDAYSAGALCIGIDGSAIDLLSSGLFSTFLPSLGVLTQGRDVPLLIALRPRNPPQVRIGKGTTRTDAGGKVVPDDPLLTVTMNELNLDFYAFIEERYARLFTLTTNVKLPIALEFKTQNGVTSVLPVLGGLDTLLVGTTAGNSEMLAEDPQALADLIGSLIGLMEPVLAGALKPIDLPEMQGFKLKIPPEGVRGVNPAIDGFEHLGIFADLEIGVPFSHSLRTEARLVEAYVPSKAELLGPGRASPRVVVEARAEGLRPVGFRGYEYSWRLHGGLWSPWIQSDRFEIASPVLRLQGRHEIEVRAREVGMPDSTSAEPAALTFRVDYDAPTVKLVEDEEAGLVRTEARDRLSADDELEFAYRVAGGAWSGYGPARAFRIEELGLDPSLEVRVRDPAGHEASAWWGVPGDQLLRGRFAPAAAAPREDFGCGSAGAPLLGVLGLLALAGRRRSRAHRG